MTVQFDTLKFKKKLTGTGITQAVKDSFENLATKADLSLFEAKLLYAQSLMKNDLIKWMVGLSFIQVGLFLSVILSFHGK